MFEQLAAQAEILRQRVLRTRGYDAVTISFNVCARAGAPEYRASIETYDEFQPQYGSEKVDVGTEYCYGETPEILFEEINKYVARLRGREQRELTYLMNKVSGAIEHRADLKSAAGRDFAAALLAERDANIHLLTGPEA